MSNGPVFADDVLGLRDRLNIAGVRQRLNLHMYTKIADNEKLLPNDETAKNVLTLQNLSAKIATLRLLDTN